MVDTQAKQLRLEQQQSGFERKKRMRATTTMKLNGNSFTEWFFRMEKVVIVQQLWSHVNGVLNASNVAKARKNLERKKKERAKKKEKRKRKYVWKIKNK